MRKFASLLFSLKLISEPVRSYMLRQAYNWSQGDLNLLLSACRYYAESRTKC